MLRGLWTLTWLEIKIFVREPLGFVGSVGIPVLMFVVLGRMLGQGGRGAAPRVAQLVSIDVPIFIALLIAVTGVLSLVTIIAIYREGGILKRLRATPLRSHTILLAHVMVKLMFTAVTLVAMILAGRRYYPVSPDVPWASFTLALLFTTVCIVSLGFLIASLVPTARFAQPLGSLVLYPLLGISGLFVPIDAMPLMLQVVARVQPFTYAVSLLRGVWSGHGWLAHLGDMAILASMGLVCVAISARVFRWE